MFLKLTSAYNNKKITVNVDSISSYGEELRTIRQENSANDLQLAGSYVVMNSGHQYTVSETVKQIEKLLSESYITVKETYESRATEVSQHSSDNRIDDTEQLQSRSP